MVTRVCVLAVGGPHSRESESGRLESAEGSGRGVNRILVTHYGGQKCAQKIAVEGEGINRWHVME